MRLQTNDDWVSFYNFSGKNEKVNENFCKFYQIGGFSFWGKSNLNEVNKFTFPLKTYYVWLCLDFHNVPCCLQTVTPGFSSQEDLYLLTNS